MNPPSFIFWLTEPPNLWKVALVAWGIEKYRCWKNFCKKKKSSHSSFRIHWYVCVNMYRSQCICILYPWKTPLLGQKKNNGHFKAALFFSKKCSGASPGVSSRIQASSATHHSVWTTSKETGNHGGQILNTRKAKCPIFTAIVAGFRGNVA